MKFYLITVVVLFNILVTSSSMGRAGVGLPDFQIVGKSLDDYILFSNNTQSVVKYPKQLIIDTNKGSIVGLVLFYDKSVSFSDVELSINEIYGNWKLTKSYDPQISLWRVTPKKISIQLSINESGLVEVIILPFRNK